MVNPIISFGHRASGLEEASRRSRKEQFECADCEYESSQPNQAELMKMQFATCSDKDLAFIAANDSKDKYKQQLKNGLLGMFVGIPVLSSAIDTLHDPGSLAKKTGIFTGSMAGWAFGLGVLFAYFGVSNALTKGSETLSGFKKDHPFAHTVLNIAGAFGSLFGAGKLADYGLNKLFQNYPSLDVKASKTFKSIGDFIDNSFVSKSIFKPIQKSIAKVMKNNPNATKNILTASTYAVPIAAIGLLIKFFSDKSKFQIEVKDKFYSLKTAQNSVREEMSED